MEQGLKGTKRSIRFTVVSIFILATVLTASIAISFQYYFTTNMAINTAKNEFKRTSQNTKEYIANIDLKAQNLLVVLSKFGDLVEKNALNDDAFNIFAEILKRSQHFYAIYIGLESGDFYELINLEASPKIREQIKASYKDRWVSVTVNGQGSERKRTFTYFDEQFNVRTSRTEESEYYAYTRPWFTDANYDEVNKTPPYLFQHLQSSGQTYSTKIPNTNNVLAIDIALSSFNGFLKNQDKSTNNQTGKEIYLLQKTGEIIASNQEAITTKPLPVVSRVPLTQAQKSFIATHDKIKVSNELDWAPIDFSISGHPQGYSIDMLTLISKMTGLQFEFINGFSWPELEQKFINNEIDILQPIFKNNQNKRNGVMSSPFLQLPFAVITQGNTPPITNLAMLNGKEVAIPRGWSIISLLKKHYPEIMIIEVENTKEVLSTVSQGTIYAGLDNEHILKYTQQQYFIDNIKYHKAIDFNQAKIDNQLHFMLHQHDSELLGIINLALQHITSDHKALLQEKWLNTDTTTEKAKKLGQQAVVPYKELIEIIKQKNKFNQSLTYTLGNKEHLIYISPVNQQLDEFFAILIPVETVLASSIDKVKFSIIITSCCLLLIIPLSWLFSGPIVKPIRLIADENNKIKLRQYDKLTKVNTNIKEIDELASSLIAMAEAIQQHERNQAELMDSFIQLIAQAIDDKSPYTGNHCKRVPDLGLMLAQAASDDKKECFQDFVFRSDDEYREFKIAAWLHDCGKIITPEHIVDKGSKLETIYNRIHEVRMRFEVLWRDADIHYYQALLKTPENKQALNKEREQTKEKLQEDFSFIATCNVGGEFMSEDKLTRLSELAKITWQRHFNDRLGLSPVEELNLSDKTSSLPATENLLQEKPEHIIQWHTPPQFDDKLGIKMPAPDHEYNLGELYNLSISRGTLTTEDRYKINEHIIGTIKMLEQLPFPPELANVPKFASTHHETLKGTGYPRKLTAEQLTIPERVLVLADIFEALTAADRPYKKAKPLSVSIDILHKFALEEHIDINLFELFLTSGIYKEYAQRHMDAKQIDDVDITKYIRAC